MDKLWKWLMHADARALFFGSVALFVVVGGIVAFALLGQVLVQAGLDRVGRGREIAGWTWPFAAAGVILTGLSLGGWV